MRFSQLNWTGRFVLACCWLQSPVIEMVFHYGGPESMDWHELTKACQDTVEKRMDWQLPNWTDAVFAVASWGGLMWKSLHICGIPLLSMSQWVGPGLG